MLRHFLDPSYHFLRFRFRFLLRCHFLLPPQPSHVRLRRRLIAVNCRRSFLHKLSLLHHTASFRRRFLCCRFLCRHALARRSATAAPVRRHASRMHTTDDPHLLNIRPVRCTMYLCARSCIRTQVTRVLTFNMPYQTFAALFFRVPQTFGR